VSAPTEKNQGYIFDDAADRRELERLRALEAIFDPKTKGRLSCTGELRGRRCLEVGAGAGSVAAWLAERVGAGRVVALDSNARFLNDLPGVEVIGAPLNAAELAPGSFDLVHTRYVTIHNADHGALLDEMVRALAPGRWLVIEEPDFSTATPLTGPDSLRRAFRNVNRAILELFTRRDMDPALGSRLPTLLQQRCLELVSVEFEAHCVPGGHALADMMRMSTQLLASKYIDTGCAREEDIEGYVAFARQPACWGIYYTTVAVAARKAASF